MKKLLSGLLVVLMLVGVGAVSASAQWPRYDLPDFHDPYELIVACKSEAYARGRIARFMDYYGCTELEAIYNFLWIMQNMVNYYSGAGSLDTDHPDRDWRGFYDAFVNWNFTFGNNEAVGYNEALAVSEGWKVLSILWTPYNGGGGTGGDNDCDCSNCNCNSNKQYFKIWGKVTKWEQKPLNWFLFLFLFGWFWMVF